MRPGEFRQANFESVNADYFRTIKTPLLEGRLLSEADGADQPPVVVVSESFLAEISLEKIRSANSSSAASRIPSSRGRRSSALSAT